jgi:hypothetical protein
MSTRSYQPGRPAGHQAPQRGCGARTMVAGDTLTTAGVKGTLRASAALRFSLALTGVP